MELSRAKARDLGSITEVIDAPGVQSLAPESEDERVTRDLLLDNPSAAVLLVADSKNVRHTLSLLVTVQEWGHPIVVALNMSDEAALRGVAVDAKAFSEITGVAAIPTVAIERKGLERVKSALLRPGSNARPITYHPRIEEAVKTLVPSLNGGGDGGRAMALSLLADDESLAGRLNGNLPEEFWSQLKTEKKAVYRAAGRDAATLIGAARRAWVERAVARVARIETRTTDRFAERLGRLAMHPVWGVPILVAVLIAVFWFVGLFGAGTAVNFLEKTVFGGYINPAATWLAGLIPIPIVQELLVGEYGVVTMALTYALAIVLPVVGTFFIAFGAL